MAQSGFPSHPLSLSLSLGFRATTTQNKSMKSSSWRRRGVLPSYIALEMFSKKANATLGGIRSFRSSEFSVFGISHLLHSLLPISSNASRKLHPSLSIPRHP
ncbi:hypothetical protein ABVK25_000697 [Lepraria finkii]|uniref:Uncharacterized protein n=1 Tax=Lepraria finkii TaxID=1340010 RepID=A0ABR4BR08_9LECA